mmetsp:Transcript_128376/g.411464  ORF Transcript_128376/g.411464 Transcript_128376/m.411464 type:complete len:305 (-) Transcript_128376:71-985(-)
MDVLHNIAELHGDLPVLLDDGVALLDLRGHLHVVDKFQALEQLVLDPVRRDGQALPSVSQAQCVPRRRRGSGLLILVVVVDGQAQVVLALAQQGLQLGSLGLEEGALIGPRGQAQVLADLPASDDFAMRLLPILLLGKVHTLQVRSIGFRLHLRALVRVDLAHLFQEFGPLHGLAKPVDGVVPPLRVDAGRVRIVGFELDAVAPSALGARQGHLQEADIREVSREGRLFVASFAVLELQHVVQAPQSSAAVLPVPQVVVMPQAVAALLRLNGAQEVERKGFVGGTGTLGRFGDDELGLVLVLGH